MLSEAAPRVGSRVAALPAEVRLSFSDAIDPNLSGLTVTAPNGASAVRGAVVISGSEMVAKLAPAGQRGVFRVRWSIHSKDGHRSQGQYTFEVHD